MDTFPLPSWIDQWLQSQPITTTRNASHTQRMAFVIELAAQNYQQGSPQEQGGPFAAAVFHKETGALLSVGVNRVIPLNTCTAHAEIIALTRAQQHLKQFCLRNDQDRPYILYTSAQMCAMCLGAICWSGVGEVVYGAKAADTERLTGFDEGPIHPHWQQELESRHIKVTGPILEKQAQVILQNYKLQNKVIYSG